MDEQQEMSRRARIIKAFVAEFNGHEQLSKRFSTENRSTNDNFFEEEYKYPDVYEATPGKLPHCNMEILKRKDQPSDWVILHLHGGGYVGAMRRQYRMMAGLYAEVSDGMTVMTLDYRVAPEHVYPAALEDARDAYHYLLEEGYLPEHMIFAGDSAGGGLAMCLCHDLSERGEALPAAIVGMSPWTDLTASGASYQDNFEIDPVFGNSRSDLIFHNPYIGDANPTDPKISPAFGDFDAFPPMLIQVGTDEMLLSDARIVAEKMKTAGRKVRLTEYYGMFHVFQMAGKLMEESSKAWAEVGRFIREVRKFE